MNDMKHHDGERFFNTGLPRKAKSFFKGLSMWLSTPKSQWPETVANTAIPDVNKNIADNQVSVTYVNHVTFLLQFNGLTVLTDPVWCKRASPFKFMGPARVRKPGISLDNLPKIDLILISHNHYDHLDAKTLKQLNKKFSPKVFCPLGDGKLISSLGFKDVEEFDWWNNNQVNDQIKITFTPMQHWSARGLFDQYKSLWGSYVIEYNNKNIFFGGDGGYCEHFKQIRQKIGAFDLSFVGIGSYEPRWFMQDMHTNPEEAAQIHLDLNSKLSVGMHFGTFQLSAESIDQPIIDLQIAKNKLQIPDNEFITMDVGQTKVFDL